MPESVTESGSYPSVPEMPPGFNELPVQDQLFIKQFRRDPDPVLGTVFLMTKLGQVQKEQTTALKAGEDWMKLADKRLRRLERFRYYVSGAVAALVALKAYLFTKVFGT